MNVLKKLFLRVKAEFSASLLQSSVSHDPSENILIFWFVAQETLLIMLRRVMVFHIFMETAIWQECINLIKLICSLKNPQKSFHKNMKQHDCFQHW